MNAWTSYDRDLLQPPGTGLTLDLSGLPGFDPGAWEDRLAPALDALAALEAGAVANPDEGRQVGHYWLRSPERAPAAAQAEAIRAAQADCVRLAGDLRRRLDPDTVLHLGIGGSALGPQLLAEALAPLPGLGGISAERYRVLDNTDPDGFEAALHHLDPARTVVLVVSKSGGTVETRNAMLRVRGYFAERGQPFAPRAVAITAGGSKLYDLAVAEGWAGTLPLWDWVGGRTSVLGPVGLLPAALLDIPGEALLAGAAAMDAAGRSPVVENPAALLAATWRQAQQDRARAMVVLPYADRLSSLARYLQQLVMESLGKRLDRAGREVRAGLTVYGNKGSTDQHAFVQQLRDGPDDFFCTFVEVRCPRGADPTLDGGYTASDTLTGFLEGTRAALAEDGKQSLTIGLDRLDARSLGALIALFERAVGIYAELIGVNAYHQPGVEAGKRAAAGVLAAQARLTRALEAGPLDAETLAERAGMTDPALAWRILRRLAACPGRGVEHLAGAGPTSDRFRRR